MKVRFEIFKSFIRVDLQLQLEVKVAYTKENPRFKAFFKQDKSQLKKKGRACAWPGQAPGCVFFLIGLRLAKNALRTRIWPGVV